MTSVAVTLARPLHVSTVSQSKEKEKINNPHPSRGLRINPTLKVREHNRVAHASMAPIRDTSLRSRDG